jgi:competence transcription factor ComK
MEKYTLTAYFDTYKKAKYRLIVNSYSVYFFVTTSRSENECIEILKEIVTSTQTLNSRSYTITKTTNGETTTIYKGSIKGL